MSGPPRPTEDTPPRAIVLILTGMVFITVNDSLIKALSGDYPLHQMIFIRSAIALGMTLVILQFEGGFRALRTSTPVLHLMRGLLVVVSNMLIFAAIATLPLATATALFFVAPLMITLMSVVFLKERVGLHRAGAIVVGFAGVLVMTRPGAETGLDRPETWVLMLPVLAATGYAGMQVMTVEQDVAITAGGSVTAALSFPARSIVFGVTGRVTDAITGTLADWRLGDTSSDDRFGSGLGTAQNSWISGPVNPFVVWAPTPLLLTANGGDFAGGTVRLALHYAAFTIPDAV